MRGVALLVCFALGSLPAAALACGTTPTPAQTTRPVQTQSFLSDISLGTLPIGAGQAPLQTGTGPVATATAGAYPDPNTLLTQSNAALTTANTFHLNMSVDAQIEGLIDEQLTMNGDVSQKPVRAHVHLAGNVAALGKGKNVNEDLILIKSKSWIKDAATHHKWKKQKSSSSGAGGVGSVTPPLTSPGNGVTIKDLAVVGPDTFAGHAVWHVHGTYEIEIQAGQTADGTVDYLIEQATSFPDQTIVALNDQQDGILLNQTMTLSNFGQAVSITKPKVGSSKP